MEKSESTKFCGFSRKKARKILLSAKEKKGFTYEDLAKAINRNKVWVAAAIHGNATFSKDEVEKLADKLELESNTKDNLKMVITKPPYRKPPEGFCLSASDPTIYRFYEIASVYGETFKALLHEECGDGIMSAIGLEVNFEVKKKDDGDHIVITYDGKFLPYKKW